MSAQRILPDWDDAELFRALVDLAPDAMVVSDERGRIVLANRQAEHLFGYSHQEFLDGHVEMLVPPRFRTDHPAHRAGYLPNPRQRPMGSGIDLFALRRDGTEFAAEISLSPIVGRKQTAVAVAIRDVTDRKRAEGMFRALVEAAPDATVIVNLEGDITLVNSQTERVFGYPRCELIGQPVELLLPEGFRRRHREHRNSYSREPKVRPMGVGQELLGRRKDGGEFPVEISLSPLQTEEGMLFSAAIRDITDRKRADEKVRASLREKEVLLKEIHHRVKNNLQVTSSLLKLQAAHTQDATVRSMFIEGQHRIRSMALVHEKLYRSSELARVPLADYATELSSLLFRSFGVDAERIALEVDADPIRLSIDNAIPCGLILNELISNALKHAFPEGRCGVVTVGIKRAGDAVVALRVRDDGVGLPDRVDCQYNDTLGLELVKTLVQQLQGELQILRAPGTDVLIRFVGDGHESE